MDEPSSSSSSSSYPSSSGGKKKRPRSPGHSDERPVHTTQIYTSSLEDTLTFSDTMIALQLMRTQFPKLEKVVTEPFILQSQLYSSVKDRTQVDRDLESLKKDKVLRVFKLNTGQDDHAIMFMDDYLKQMALAVKRSRGKDQDGTEVFGWFERYVIHLKLEVSIDQRDLFSLLSLGGDVTDKHITLLMNAGLLTRQLIDPNMYWFSIPSIGPVLKGLTQGRKEILSLLNRKKYKEMLLSSLEKTRLRFSPLDVRFHIRDLIGSGHIKTVQTPTGLLVRISKD
uniref:Serine/threonine-protein kinase 19 n=1 Tax=Oryza rufipogon TaxID=4529 RepID=A0A0E0Q7T2_ORYRU